MNFETFFNVTYGLYIVSSRDGERLNAHISNTVFQVTATPPQIAICSNKDNLTTDFILKSKVFSVSIIQQDVDLNFIGKFGFKSGKNVNKFENLNYKTGISGAPIVLDKTIGYIDCKVNNMLDAGSHIIIVGEVVDADIIQTGGSPLTYNYYRNVIKGISPKNSPTYINKDKLESIKKIIVPISEKYVCSACGYVYDSEIGDEASQIHAGSKFDDLPEDWLCPVCGSTKDFFDKIY
jgi:flavin reductase (DIM6/NTAB) family NADH-FMN oxidoreductase RutF/rubredoxin